MSSADEPCDHPDTAIAHDSQGNPFCVDCGSFPGPLRLCDDCKFHMGSLIDSLRCPLYGKSRIGVERRCTVFVPKAAQ